MELPVSNSELHAILVHFPIALAIAGVPLVLVAAFAASGRVLRWVSVALYAAVALSAYAAYWSGEQARKLIPNTYPDAVWDILDAHEELAASVWIGAAITAVFLAIGASHYRWLRIPATTVAFVGSVMTATFVGTTGHFGGQLVYKHGIGTPGAAALYGPPATTPPATPTPPASPSETPERPDTHFFQDMDGMNIAATPPPSRDPQATLGPPDEAPEEPAPAANETGAADAPAIDQAEARAVSYVRDVAPIMEAHCNECHYDGDAEGDLVLTSVAAMMAGGEKAGAAILPGDPDNSPLILYILGTLKPQMPKRRPPLADDEVQVLRMWIQAGAVDDSAAPHNAID